MTIAAMERLCLTYFPSFFPVFPGDSLESLDSGQCLTESLKGNFFCLDFHIFHVKGRLVPPEYLLHTQHGNISGGGHLKNIYNMSSLKNNAQSTFLGRV